MNVSEVFTFMAGLEEINVRWPIVIDSRISGMCKIGLMNADKLSSGLRAMGKYL